MLLVKFLEQMAFEDYIEDSASLLWLIPQLVLYGGQPMVQVNVPYGGEIFSFELSVCVKQSSL